MGVEVIKTECRQKGDIREVEKTVQGENPHPDEAYF